MQLAIPLVNEAACGPEATSREITNKEQNSHHAKTKSETRNFEPPRSKMSNEGFYFYKKGCENRKFVNTHNHFDILCVKPRHHYVDYVCIGIP